MFELDSLPRFELQCIDNNGHWYVTPDGTFPSVTNVLGRVSDKRYLYEWRDRIGNEEANAITEQSRAFGTLIHGMAQKYMLQDDSWNKVSTINRSIFKPIKRILDSRITKVLGVELPVWSKDLKTAGTSDLVAEWYGVPTIIDYKTSRRPMQNDSNKLATYKLQVTAYAMMVEKMYGLKIPACVILVILQSTEPQIFSFDNRPFRREVIDIFSAEHILQFYGETHVANEKVQDA